MPLLRRQNFVRLKPPPDIKPQDEVFFCKMTNEIFRDYEEFFERIILCNSLVWSCSITGRSGMTFQEALECEERARKHLATFPNYLERPILYLASLTHRSRLVDLNDDVFVYAKDRFFKGETVDVLHGSARKICKIMKVVIPNMQQLLNGSAVDSSESDGSDVEEIDCKTGSPKKVLNVKPSKVQYVVLEEGKTNTIIVKGDQIVRRKGVYTRDKSKLYLKQHCEPEQGLWKVKESILKKYNLHGAKFDDFFAGHQPSFQVSPIKKKTNLKKLNMSASDTSPTDKKKRKKADVDEKPKKKQKKAELEAPVLPDEGLQHLSKEERIAMREREREEKRILKIAQKEEMRKQMDAMKERMKEERAKEREKLMEERKKQIEQMKEWSRPREDLECDDLLSIPEATPITTRLSPSLFGEAIMVLEFLHAFSELFGEEDQFPATFTLDGMERALLESDISTPLTDLVKFLLNAVYSLQDEEEEEELQLMKGEENKDLTEHDGYFGSSDVSIKHLIQTATSASLTPQLYHGISLRKMSIDTFTLTEILRLHFMSSGARVGAKNNKFRYQQRGGYTPLDDPGMEFKKLYPGVLRSLAVSNVFDFAPEEKVQIIMALIHQLLTYATARDFVEENFDKIRQQRMDLKQLQWGELRREREEAHNRYRKKMEERAREKERQADLKALKMKEKEGVLQEVQQDDGIEREVEVGPPVEIKKPTPPQMSAHAVKKFMRDLDGKVSAVLNSKTQRPRGKKNNPEDFQTVEELLAEMDKVEEDQLEPEDIERFKIKREELEIRRKEDYVQKEKEIAENFIKLQSGIAVYPVGRDRFYRRYWVFRSLPGLFIENNDEFIPEYMFDDSFNTSTSFLNNSLPLKCQDNKNGLEDKSTSSDKENESFELTNGNTKLHPSVNKIRNHSGTGGEDIPVIDLEPPELDDDDDDVILLEDDKPPELDLCVDKSLAQRKISWSYISSTEEFDELLKSLNVRGFREGLLKQSLQEQKPRIVDSIKNCQHDILKSDQSDGKKGASKKCDTAQELLELNLRDMLLEIEERIYVGSLGAIKVKDRIRWRDAIERGGYNPETNDPTFHHSNDLNEDRMSEASEGSLSAVRDLAMILLQIARGLEPKFLGKPLGETDVKKGKQKSKKKGKSEKRDSDAEGDDDDSKPVLHRTFERWEETLLQCTSLSQIYLYLATLELSITWSKSALHARCRICRRKGDAEKMLLCDGCDRGHHMYCLKPVVKHIPQGDWYCPECRPKEVRTPRKERRRTFTEEAEDEVEEDGDVVEESNDSSEEEELVASEEEEEESSEDDANDNNCTICKKGGKLLCCDNCPLSYHLRCADPPLSKVPKGKWLCQACKKAENRAGKIKISKGTKPKKKSTPNSSQSGSRRSSPLTVKSLTKKRRHSDADQVAGTSKQAVKSSRLSLDPSAGLDSDANALKSLSSYRNNSKVQQMKACEDMVNDLMKEESAWPFLKPVSKKLVPDYYDVITKPMDFSTIRNRINRYEYADPISMLADIRQIFQNCEKYNLKTSEEYKAGIKLSKFFEKNVLGLRLTLSNSTNDSASKKRPRRN